MERSDYIVLRVERQDFGGLFTPSPFAQGNGGLDVEISVQIEEALTVDELIDLRRDPGVQAVARDIPMHLVEPTHKESAPQPSEAGDVTWGVIATRALESPFTGSGVTVAVVDTGIDATHEAFQGMQLVQADFTGEGDEDLNGHGTHVAGTIFGREINGSRFGVAPGIEKAYIAKVLDGAGRGSSAWIYKGIQWAIDQGANVVNMSLGYNYPGLVQRWIEAGFPADLATSLALEDYLANVRFLDALANLVRERSRLFGTTLLIAAAGNESKRHIDPNYEISVAPPAVANGIISVGALLTSGAPHDSLEVATFSNTGPNVVGPGVGVYSAVPGNQYASWNGTSMASPHVAGVAALWAQKLLNEHGTLNLFELTSRLVGQATDSKFALGIDKADVGVGLIQAPLA